MIICNTRNTRNKVLVGYPPSPIGDSSPSEGQMGQAPAFGKVVGDPARVSLVRGRKPARSC